MVCWGIQSGSVQRLQLQLNVVEVWSGYGTNCVRSIEGDPHCWGDDEDGQIETKITMKDN